MGPVQKFDGVIFDMDGCLVDSEPLCLGAIADEMHSLGLEDINVEDLAERFLGVTMSKIEEFTADRLGHPVPSGFQKRVEDNLIDRYRSDLNHIEGAKAALHNLRKHGLKLGLATGASRHRMGATLEISGLARCFGDHAVSADDVAAGKPAPDIFIEAANRIQVRPSACLVVEDSPHGVTGALRAGMSAIGFVGGSHLNDRRDKQTKTLKDAGAVKVFEDLDTLQAFVLAGSEASA